MSNPLWSWVLSIQALIVVAILADGKRRIFACWFGLFTEPLWIIYAVTTGQPGFAALGGVYLLSYVWGLIKESNAGKRIRERGTRIRARLFPGRNTYVLVRPTLPGEEVEPEADELV